jgi:integrase
MNTNMCPGRMLLHPTPSPCSRAGPWRCSREVQQPWRPAPTSSDPLQPSTWWQVWQKVRAASLTPSQLESPLMKRPYDLRHSGVTWRLNSGVPATEVAAWAGHSVEVLTRVYARCVIGLEGVWIGRMDQALHLEEDR